MSLGELYNWQAQIREMFSALGYWQSLVLAMYSLGMVLARQSAPSKVAEKLGVLGKPDTVQRRLERFVDNDGIQWQGCCVAWSRWVISRYSGERLIVLVDETKLGQHLSVMMVGLAAVCRWRGGPMIRRCGRWVKSRSLKPYWEGWHRLYPQG